MTIPTNIEFFGTFFRHGGVVKYTLSDTRLKLEWTRSGETRLVDLSEVVGVQLDAGGSFGSCTLRLRAGPKVVIRSTSNGETGDRENEIKEYTEFIDALHERLELLAPAAIFRGKNSSYISTGLLLTILTSIPSLAFSFFLLEQTDLIGLHILFLLPLALIGPVLGIPSMLMGRARDYSPKAVPFHLLPAPKKTKALKMRRTDISAYAVSLDRHNMPTPQPVRGREKWYRLFN